MSSREFLQHRWTVERPAFERVLHALPLAKFAYSPHERSPSAAQILWTLALEARACSELIDARETNWVPDPPPAEELEDPLLELLRSHESLNQEEFLQKLRQQRSSEEVTSA